MNSFDYSRALFTLMTVNYDSNEESLECGIDLRKARDMLFDIFMTV